MTLLKPFFEILPKKGLFWQLKFLALYVKLGLGKKKFEFFFSNIGIKWGKKLFYQKKNHKRGLFGQEIFFFEKWLDIGETN